MRIILVAQNYLPFIGGVETHARQVAHELAKSHEVSIIAANFAACTLPSRLTVLHASLLTPAYSDFNDEGVPVHALTPSLQDRIRLSPIALRAVPVLNRYAYHRLNTMGYSWFRRVYLRRMLELLKGADVVHSLAGGYLGWAAQEAAKRLKIPFVCTPFVHPQQWGDGPEDITYYRRAAGVIGLVKSDRDYLEEIGVPAKKLHTIGVSPDLPPIQDPVGFRQRHHLEGLPIVLYVGRMMAQKGAESVVAAAQHVWEKFPDTQFVFIGPGSPESEKWFANKDSRIHYLGRVSSQEKADALAACDIFCMPSLSEILPTVYLEAWSLSKPVIGGMAHGLPELVEGNQAGFNSSQDPMELSGKITQLLQNPDLGRQLGETGRDLVNKNYSVSAVTSELLSLYNDVVALNKRQ